jgi:hypothetical protein
MWRASARVQAVDLTAMDVECTTCGLTMTAQLGSGGRVRYFHCARCQRWSTSQYDEMFTGQAGMRCRAPRPPEPPSEDDVQARIARWLRSLAPAV